MSGDINHIRPWRAIPRRKSRKIRVGNLYVGGDAPILVQSMTNTPTEDAKATIAQIRQLEEAGADIVRVSCPDEESTAAMPEICRAAKMPIVADIHFHYKRGIEAAKAGAAVLRINPGNIGSPARVKEVIQAAKDHGCSMRIGVNGGSLEKHLLEKYGEPCPDAMVDSALEHARILDDNDFHEYKISVKASDVFMTVAAYQKLAEVTDAPLHLGITEAGATRPPPAAHARRAWPRPWLPPAPRSSRPCRRWKVCDPDGRTHTSCPHPCRRR
jgi:(E)-4-hydroxy-3-methylbut-2-enyl-diphosphate synthase